LFSSSNSSPQSTDPTFTHQEVLKGTEPSSTAEKVQVRRPSNPAETHKLASQRGVLTEYQISMMNRDHKILPTDGDDSTLSQRASLDGGDKEEISWCCNSDDKSETWEDFKSFLGRVNYSCAKEATKWLLDQAGINLRFTIDDLMMAMTIFVLFADNIKLMTASKSVDDDFITINAVCFFAFLLELVLNTWSKTKVISFIPWNHTGYMLTFFWTLDVVAILSMLPDIPWIADPIGLGGISSSLSSTNKLSKAGRVVRLVRLVRLVKLYKIASERRKKAKQEEEMMELVRTGALRYEEVVKQRELYNTRQSRLGEQLSESTTQRVVIIVLIMVCVLPLLDVPAANYGPDFSTRLLQSFNIDSLMPGVATQNVLDTYLRMNAVTPNGYESLLRLTMSPFKSGLILNKAAEVAALRPEALDSYLNQNVIGGVVYITAADFSFKWLEYENAMFAILTTSFIALLLVAGSLVLTGDTQKMVITPIERMMNMVEAVARDPLQNLSFDHSDSKGGSGEYETRLLETTIEKITGLLRVGFGEAGAGIISANLQVQTSGGESAAVNPLLPGVRIYAVIGFCDIHHFEEINQLLTNDVLIFVNTIAEIVHSRVHYWGGQCNKNLGNAFVIIWRIGDELDVQLQSQGGSKGSVKVQKKSLGTKVVDLRRVPGVDKLADHALVGYLKIIAEINRNTAVLDYRNEPRLTHNNTKEFKVSMGFGLHAGWAIEGAVGSIHKVDATYLSPHVNMAARLETSSRQYGVPILISQNAFDLFSNETQNLCRKCDVVTVKGSEVPIGIFTYDSLQNQQFPRTTMQVKQHDDGVFEPCPEEEEARERREAFFAAQGYFAPPFEGGDDSDDDIDLTEYTGNMREAISTGVSKIFFGRNNIESSDLFSTDTDLRILRMHATNEDFLFTFKSGVEEYLDGNWASGKQKLSRADAIMAKLCPALGGDGPSKTLLEYMEEFGPDAPSWWKGYRPLTAK